MKRTENTKTFTLKGGNLRLGTRRTVGKEWYIYGYYVSPRGMCSVYYEAKNVVITTVVNGTEHKVTVEGKLTPAMISHRCCKLLKSLTLAP